jgi:hypothetical protein
MAQGKVGFRKAAPKGVPAEPETMLKADKTTPVVKAEKAYVSSAPTSSTDAATRLPTSRSATSLPMGHRGCDRQPFSIVSNPPFDHVRRQFCERALETGARRVPYMGLLRGGGRWHSWE